MTADMAKEFGIVDQVKETRPTTEEKPA